MNSNRYIVSMSCFRSYQVGKTTAYLLLFLLSLSFALENQIFFENDVMEIVELTEKEIDPKEKKLLFGSNLSISANPLESNLKSSFHCKKIMPKSIYLERKTPPPECV